MSPETRCDDDAFSSGSEDGGVTLTQEGIDDQTRRQAGVGPPALGRGGRRAFGSSAMCPDLYPENEDKV